MSSSIKTKHLISQHYQPKIMATLLKAVVMFTLTFACVTQAVYIGPIPNTDFKSGRVLARSIVLDPVTNLPILVEFALDGDEVAKVDLGSVSVADVGVIPSADYFFFKNQLNEFIERNAQGSALGGQLLSRNEFEQATFLLSDNKTQVLQGPLPDGVNSVFVRGQSSRFGLNRSSAQAVNDELILLNFTFDFTQDIVVADNSVSLVVNQNGLIVAQSSNRIGFRTGFFGDPSEAQNDRGFKIGQDDTVFGPVKGVKVSVDEHAYPGGVGVSDSDGKYSFRFFLPTCPVGGFTFTTDVTAELHYRNFLPTGAPSIPYYLRTPGYSHCSAFSVPSIVALNVAGILATSPTSIAQSNLYADVMIVNGLISLQNSDNSPIVIGDTTYTAFEEPADLVTQNFYDFNGDGVSDHVEQGRILFCTRVATDDGKPLIANQEAEVRDVFLIDSVGQTDLDDVVEHFSCVNTDSDVVASDKGGKWQGIFFDGRQDNQFDYPDLVRVIDTALRSQPIGLIKSISQDDLRNTDVLFFRESTGQLILERRGLKQSEASYRPAVAFDEDTNQVAYRILLRGPNDSALNVGGGINRRQSFEDWATDYQLTEPFAKREGDQPRPGEYIKIVAINRATGYTGTARVKLTSAGGSGLGLLDVVAPAIILRPPNLKVWAERDYTVDGGLSEGEDRTFTVGNDGAALTSDSNITIFTQWLDESGGPLPDELGLGDGGQYGLTGRLARVAGENQLVDASVGSDLAEFSISPGRHTQVLRVNDNLSGAEHFYVHVIGKPREQECVPGSSCPSFDVSSVEPSFAGRPSLLTPFLTPLSNENQSWVEFRVYQQARQLAATNNTASVPLEPLPSYVWQYRPEYQFSQYDLEIQEINRNSIAQGGAQSTVNLLDSGQVIVGLDDTALDIFYSLTGPELDRLSSIDLGQDLVFSFGGNEQRLTFNNDETITFDDLASLQHLNPEDFLNIRLYSNNDAGNILFEYELGSVNNLPGGLQTGVNSIELTRTTSLGMFNSTQTSTSTIRNVTDSFTSLNASVSERSLVNVEVFDEGFNSLGLLINNEEMDPGQYGIIVTYADMDAFVENNETFYFAINQRNLRNDVESRTLYTGQTRRQIDSELLGQVIEHDGLIQRGALTLRREDISLSGVGPQLNFIRSYSNEQKASNQASPMGSGWNHNHNISLQVLSMADARGVFGNNLPVWIQSVRSGGKPEIVLVDEFPDQNRIPQLVSVSNGGLFIFQNGQWRPSRGFHGRLNFVGDHYEYVSKEGTTYVFSNGANGGEPNVFRVEQIVDRNNNALRYEYANIDTSRQVSKVTDATGRTLSFNYRFYDSLGAHRLSSVNSPETGINLTFDYDASDEFDVANIDTAGLLTGFARDNFNEQYSYVRTELDNIANLASTTDAVGNVTSYHYLEPDSVPSELLTFADGIVKTDVLSRIDYPAGMGSGTIEYDFSSGNQRRVSDLNGNIKTYTLNEFGNPQLIEEPLGRTTELIWTIDQGLDDVLLAEQTDGLGRVTSYQYDGQGNVVRQTDPIGTVTQTWDQAFSVMQSRVDRNGNTVSYLYDDRGNATSQIDAEGFVTRHTYAANGLRLTSRYPSNGGVSNYTYDDYGNLSKMVMPEGSTTKYENDSRGNQLKMTDPNGNVTVYEYDELDRVIGMRHPDSFTSAYTYDAKGNKTSETDKLGLTLEYEYDPRDRVIRVTRSFGGGAQELSYDNQSNILTETDWLGQTTTHTYDTLHRNVETTNRIGDKMTMAYDVVNNVLSSKDYRRLETTYEYDNGDRNIRQTNPDNDSMVYTYDDENNVLSQRDYEGRVTRYEYDKRYLLTKQTDPLDGVASTTYDGRGNATRFEDEEGRVTTYQYDRQNRNIATKDPLGFTVLTEYDDNSNAVKITDRRGFTVLNSYDSIDRLVQRVDADGFVWRYGYDANNNQVSMVDGNDHETKYEYDTLNRITKQTSAVGGVVTYGYDGNNNLVSSKDAIGTVYQKTYDALDRAITETQAVGLESERSKTTRYDPNNNVLSVTNFRGFTTAYQYDALNRVDQITDALGQIMSHTYDGVGNKRSLTDKRGFVTGYEYDDLDRLVRTTDALSQVVESTYDAVGNILSITDKRGTVTTNTYDLLNRLLEVSKPDVVGHDIRVIKNEYDGEGNTVAVTDANDNRTEYQFNGRGLQTHTINPDGTKIVSVFDGATNNISLTDEIGQVTSMMYDDANRQISVTNFANERTDLEYDLNSNKVRAIQPKGNDVTYVYDGLNRVKQVTDGEANVTRYEFDGNDNQTAHVDANQNRVSYEFDELDRRVAHNQPNSLSSTFSYDPDNNMTGRVDKNGQVFSYNFDAINREIRKDFPSVDSPFMRIDSIETDYDANNNPIRITENKFNIFESAITTDICDMEYDLLDRQTKNTQRGHEINYVYDDNGNRKQVSSAGGSTDYTYDSRNRLATATTSNGTSRYVYTGDSKKESVSYPNGTVTRYTFDNADRVLSVRNEQGDDGLATLISSFEYSYDINSNRLTQVETQNGFTANQVQTTRYVYDNTNRMTAYAIEDHDTGKVNDFTYTFDANYNRIREVESERPNILSLDETVTKDQRSEFDGNNRLTRITDELSLDNNDIAYLYDNNGNTLTKTDNIKAEEEVTSFLYDSRNQLSQVIRGPPTSQTNQGYYDYNYMGLRVRHLASERGDIEYIYDGKSILEERDLDSSSLVAHYRYSDRLISLSTQTDEQYYHYSALRTTANLTNRLGQTQASYRTDVWGHITQEQGNSPNRQVFTGQEHDKNTGLIYFGARFYDPDTGRFINEDTYLGESLNAPSLHRYLYAYANPGSYVDHHGNFAVTDWIAKKLDSASQSQSAYIASLDSKLGDGFFSDVSVRLVGVGVALTKTVTEVAGASASLADVAVDYGLSTTLGDVEIFGQNSQHRTSDRIDAIGKKAEAVYAYGTQKDLSGALKRDANLAWEGTKEYGRRVKSGDITVTSEIGAGFAMLPLGAAVKTVKVAKFLGDDKNSPSVTGEKKVKDGAQQTEKPIEQPKKQGSICDCCFVAGTLVATADGLKPIEQIKIGELVASRDTETGEVDFKPVTTLFKFDDDRVTYLLTLVNDNGDEERYEVTDNHPFNVVGKGWVDSIDLQAGMQVPSYNGGVLEVVGLEPLNRSPITYNIEVDDFHTYFVGEQGAWVHNCDECSIGSGGSGGSQNLGARTSNAPNGGGNPSGNPTPKMRDRFRDNGVLDPLTNKLRPLRDGEKVAVDHIYPKDRIKKLDGYDQLTNEQKKKLLNDEYELGNLQPLPGGLNSSKGNKVDWNTYKKEGLDPTYVDELKKRQQSLETKIQDKIYDLGDE